MSDEIVSAYLARTDREPRHQEPVPIDPPTEIEAFILGHFHRDDEPPLPAFEGCGCTGIEHDLAPDSSTDSTQDTAPSWPQPARELPVPESE